MKNYILLIDPIDEILGLQETIIKSISDIEVVTLTNSDMALGIVEEKGPPDLILMDGTFFLDDMNELHWPLEKFEVSFPVVAFFASEIPSNLNRKYPFVTAMLGRPIDSSSYRGLIKSLIKVNDRYRPYMPVSLSILLRLGMGHFDLYLKLSENNFVKIFHKGDSFFDSDAKNLADKGFTELYIKSYHGQELLKVLEVDASFNSNNPIEDITFAMENVESFEVIAKIMGWTLEVFVSAQENLKLAVKVLSKNTDILKVMKSRLKDPTSAYSRHLGLLSYLVCAFSESLEGFGETSKIKLTLAALMHDVAVDDSYYTDIKSWNKKAADLSDKSPETIRYRMHPYEASKLIRILDSFSPDVEQILLQHHEVYNGTGFPRGLNASRIGPLPALFIMVEDLVEFIADGDNIESSVIDFITWGQAVYESGHFKKIFKSIESKMRIKQP